MTALAQERMRKSHARKHFTFTLASGTKAQKNGRAAFDPSTGKVVPATSKTGIFPAGIFDYSVDATSGDQPVSVDLEREIDAEWWVNATSTDAVATTDIGSICYMMDDQTVTITGAGRSPSGRVVAVDAVKGVLVERIDPKGRLLSQPAVGSYTANDYAPASVEHDAIYKVPATGAASTITLPASAPDGTRVFFAADGTANANTVQYRDATGPTNLTTALTASKRHLVVLVKVAGNWTANAYVSP